MKRPPARPRLRSPLGLAAILFLGLGPVFVARMFAQQPGTETPAYRIWTSADGREIEAAMIDGTDQSVTLRLKDGRRYELPLEKLSPADRERVAEALRQAALDRRRELGLTEGPYAAHLTGEWEKMTAEDGLRFHFFAGKNLKAGRQYPLCVYLHGSSNTGSNLEKREPGANGFAAPEVYEANPSIVIAPEAPEGTRAFKAIAPRLLALIDHLTAHLPVDRDRLYVTGYSMGGRGAWALLLADGQRFAAAAPVAGPFENGDELSRLPAIPLWLHFGELDRAEEFRALAAKLQALNPRFRSTEWPGADHTGFHSKVARDPAFYEWLFAQRRGAPAAEAE
ncbi:MAG: dienelactone hydrolase family protein [Akkermansiaceae bacterium]|nr:dienelactone hydrolase family protein [Akkermansiaceae bacterium]MCP5550710.1 dienelactone hydrolase family protein [Akkermansiaceae bacterium]